MGIRWDEMLSKARLISLASLLLPLALTFYIPKSLATELMPIYGNSFSARRLQDYRQFYLYFKDIEIWHSRVPNLTWTHYRELLTVSDETARHWYMKEAVFIMTDCSKQSTSHSCQRKRNWQMRLSGRKWYSDYNKKTTLPKNNQSGVFLYMWNNFGNNIDVDPNI